ncbi:MAG: hypothetical protein AAF217_04145 [Pseudomonadota bacterium]
MNALAPYYRGYRLALRDIQAAIELCGHEYQEDWSTTAAIFMLSDRLAIELCYLKTMREEF